MPRSASSLEIHHTCSSLLLTPRPVMLMESQFWYGTATTCSHVPYVRHGFGAHHTALQGRSEITIAARPVAIFHTQCTHRMQTAIQACNKDGAAYVSNHCPSCATHVSSCKRGHT
jgi:hypothetical protein